jgi:hypothetical protein
MKSPLNARYDIRVTSSSPAPQLSSKKRVRDRVVEKRARLTGYSWISLLWAMERVCVGCREEAVSKSMLSLLEKSFSVEGAEGEEEVRMRME